jgi:uncharacterized damage-inducible protein DinB
MSQQDNTEPRSTRELTDRILAARSELKQVFSGLSEAQMIQPGADGGWSVKDHLAHLAAWERGIVALLNRQPRWPAMGLDEETVDRSEEDEINAMLDQLNRGRALADVLADFEQAHRDMLAVLERLSFDDLLKPYSDYDPGVDSRNPVLGSITGNTCDHYTEHRPWVQKVVAHVAGG